MQWLEDAIYAYIKANPYSDITAHFNELSIETVMIAKDELVKQNKIRMVPLGIRYTYVTTEKAVFY